MTKDNTKDNTTKLGIIAVIAVMIFSGGYRLLNPVDESDNTENQFESQYQQVSEDLQEIEAEKADKELQLQRLNTEKEAKTKIKEGLEILETLENPKDQAPQS